MLSDLTPDQPFGEASDDVAWPNEAIERLRDGACSHGIATIVPSAPSTAVDPHPIETNVSFVRAHATHIDHLNHEAVYIVPRDWEIEAYRTIPIHRKRFPGVDPEPGAREPGVLVRAGLGGIDPTNDPYARKLVEVLRGYMIKIAAEGHLTPPEAMRQFCRLLTEAFRDLKDASFEQTIVWPRFHTRPETELPDFVSPSARQLGLDDPPSGPVQR